MARKRTLKVYFAIVTSKAVVGDTFDHLPRHQRNIGGFVAAYNATQARDLLALTSGEWSMSGRVSTADHHQVALGEPGQVFIEAIDSWGKPIGGAPVRAGRDDGLRLKIGAPSSLEAADERIAAETAAAAQRKQRAIDWKQDQKVRRQRAIETEDLVIETIRRTAPILERLGINQQTVSLGSHGERRGVLIPAETFEMLLRLADNECIIDLTEEQ